jgi:AAA family ATP:ADP antiporter
VSTFARLFNLHSREAPSVLAGLLMFFLLFTGYFMLRPVRETMGVAGGVGTTCSGCSPAPSWRRWRCCRCSGWLASRVARRRIMPWAYGFFVANLLLFAAVFLRWPENPWAARSFYIWLSVFNLVAISLAWSVLTHPPADVFSTTQAKRLFGMIAGGASLGGLTGPGLGALLVAPVGHVGLLMLAALLLAAERRRRGMAVPLARPQSLAGRDAVAGGEPAMCRSAATPSRAPPEVARTPFLDRHRRVRGAAGQRQHLSLLTSSRRGWWRSTSRTPPGRPRCSA